MKRFWRGTLWGGLLLVVCASVLVAQQTGPIGQLRGRTDADGNLLFDTGGAALAALGNLADIETYVGLLYADVATGSTLKRYISAGASEDESEVKATSGILMGISARNSHATADAYIKCTNATAANTAPGTTAIFYEILVPAGPSGNNDTTINAAFSTALTCYIVLSKEDNAVDEVAASTVSYNLRYR